MSPVPWWAFEPASEISPPITNDGSCPACCRITVMIEVVVVLPWVPATAIVRRSVIAAARASAGQQQRAQPGHPHTADADQVHAAQVLGGQLAGRRQLRGVHCVAPPG